MEIHNLKHMFRDIRIAKIMSFYRILFNISLKTTIFVETNRKRT